MSEETETAGRFRLQAQELRTIAAEMTIPEIRTRVLHLVKDYERMAKTMEEIDRTNQTLRLPPGWNAQDQERQPDDAR